MLTRLRKWLNRPKCTTIIMPSEIHTEPMRTSIIMKRCEIGGYFQVYHNGKLLMDCVRPGDEARINYTVTANFKKAW